MKNRSDRTEQLKNRLKYIKINDILSFFPMIIGFFISLFFRMKHKNLWLICERKNEARDNGYWFFKYMCENHSEIESVYAIDNRVPDYKKVKNLGKTISFGTVKHWVYYFTAKYNISSQKEGKPNVALCFFLEVVLGLRKNRVYLKHGIIKDAQRWIYYDISKIKQINCAVYKEYEYIKENFGYPESNVKLTGLCRYDNLKTKHNLKNQILVMPTMREWLRTINNETLLYESSSDFRNSEYFKKWNGFLRSNELNKILISYDTYLIFYLHSSMQKYIDYFINESDRIIIANSKDYDVQSLLIESKMLITDYSSIFFDFAYMEKPLIYYQFDYEKYRKGQYQEGYFSYINDGFGPVIKEEVNLLKEVEIILQNDCIISELFKTRVKTFFTFHDNKNCERTYNSIFEMNKKR